VNTYLGRRNDNWIIENAELAIPLPGERSRHDATCCEPVVNMAGMVEGIAEKVRDKDDTGSALQNTER
jgi:hypothetical protein